MRKFLSVLLVLCCLAGAACAESSLSVGVLLADLVAAYLSPSAPAIEKIDADTEALDDPLASALAEQWKKTWLDPDYRLLMYGTDSPEELAALYSMADVYVNLTLEDTFPTTNLEALACGTPVVTYKAGGSPESIDETCGETVDRNSVQGVVAAIEKIMAAKGENYTVEKCLRKAQLYSKEYRFLEYIQMVYEAF